MDAKKLEDLYGRMRKHMSVDGLALVIVTAQELEGLLSLAPKPEADKSNWESLYEKAETAVDAAFAAIDDISSWSGSSGNWPLQESSGRIRKAMEAFKEKHE